MISDSVPGINGQTVDMDDGKSGFVGSKVDLRCRFINSSPPVKISQVFPHAQKLNILLVLSFKANNTLIIKFSFENHKHQEPWNQLFL